VQHCDPDVLSLAALGEPLDDADAAHLASCAQCRASLADLVRVVDGVRVDVPAGPPVPPPPSVWEGIAAQTGVATRPRTEPPAAVVPLEAARNRPGPGGAGSASRWRVLAVAASALVVGALGGSLVTRAVIERPAQRTVVMQVQLAALPLAPDAGGSATVVRGVNGRDLIVDVSRLGTRPGQFYEVWLIDRSVHKMVAVGILDGTTGRFALPASVDLDQYPVVDISVQQPGDPRHSGRSVLRGTLPA